MKARLIACLLALATVTAFGQATTQPAPASAEAGSPLQEGPITTGLRVFTCGNSFHAWYVPTVMADMAQKAGIQSHVIVGVSKIGGSQAIQHWNVPDDKNEAKTALIAGQVDVLTLACMLHPDQGIENFTRLAYEHNPAVRVTIQEFWIPGDLFVWPLPKEKTVNDFDASTVDSLKALHDPYFKEMDAYVAALNAKLGKQVLFVVPAGQAILSLRTKVIAGKPLESKSSRSSSRTPSAIPNLLLKPSSPIAISRWSIVAVPLACPFPTAWRTTRIPSGTTRN